MKPPPVCPVCGEDVPRAAKACPECGADERTGWKEDAHIYDGLDLPDEAWGDESAGTRGPKEGGVFWKIAAALLLISLVWWMVARLF